MASKKFAALMDAFRAPSHLLRRQKKDDEGVEVVLRRQVPIRFSEDARSWLGGLPRMPQNIAWPRAKTDNAPLHFLAQIACADLPKNLWNGRGPRTGWLLLFVETLQMEAQADSSLIRVLHINKLGPESETPSDMPVFRSDVVYSFYNKVFPLNEGIPKVWRRWPIDLVARKFVRPELGGAPHSHSGGSRLYDGPVDVKHINQLVEDDQQPLTWRGALYTVNGILRYLYKDDYAKTFGGLGLRAVPPNLQPGWLALAIEACKEGISEAEVKLAEAKTRFENSTSDEGLEEWKKPKRVLQSAQHELAVFVRRLEGLLPFSGPNGEAALSADVERSASEHISWILAQRPLLEDMRAAILKMDLNGILAAPDWLAMKSKLTSSPAGFWSNTYGVTGLHKGYRTLFSFGSTKCRDAVCQDLLDLYTRSSTAKESIPVELLVKLEAKLRHVGSMPHKMGGLAESVQGFDDLESDELLFQLGSDNAMGWMWGDWGGLTVRIPPAKLDLHEFDAVHGSIEGH